MSYKSFIISSGMQLDSCFSQCCVYMDQPASGGVRAVWFRARCTGPGASHNQCGAGGAPPHSWCGGDCGPRGYTNQLQGREAAYAPP